MLSHEDIDNTETWNSFLSVSHAESVDAQTLSRQAAVEQAVLEDVDLTPTISDDFSQMVDEDMVTLNKRRQAELLSERADEVDYQQRLSRAKQFLEKKTGA